MIDVVIDPRGKPTTAILLKEYDFQMGSKYLFSYLQIIVTLQLHQKASFVALKKATSVLHRKLTIWYSFPNILTIKPYA